MSYHLSKKTRCDLFISSRKERSSSRRAKWLRMKDAGMPEKPEGPRELPAFSCLDELVRFVDENDLGDYLDAMPEAHFDVNLKKRVGIERELYEKLDEVARRRNTMLEGLVNAWVREKLKAEAASK